ncbi:Alpha-D-kanosaminyltransferase [termite gut metagenome]|uniref:Alpha-D-kanosaminyltransferase n=1 Tax=termite gut metagenome TaxID=433724 RepID=A0A5J4S325_9ZZZZ
MNAKKINIVYLYAELQPYVIVVLKELIKQKAVTIHVVHWDKKKLTPYVAPPIKNIYYYGRSQFKTVGELFQMVRNIEPSVIYTSGWMDKTYMFVCRKIRKNLSIPVVAGIDSPWHGGRQWLNVIASPFLHKKNFSYLQISGACQYEYAHRLGFCKKDILIHNCSADTELFHKIDISRKEKQYPRQILYIGRFSPEKGLKYLIDAWHHIINKKNWSLTLIGNGPEKGELLKNEDIKILDFTNQEELMYYMQLSGCFILPSIEEHWGVVLHEAAAGGLPILASNICGAVPCFVINNYNGFTFTPGNSMEIQIALEKIINSSDEQLLEMSHNSRELSKRITPKIVAKMFLSVL